MSLKQNNQNIADNIFECILLNEKMFILFKITL